MLTLVAAVAVDDLFIHVAVVGVYPVRNCHQTDEPTYLLVLH